MTISIILNGGLVAFVLCCPFDIPTNYLFLSGFQASPFMGGSDEGKSRQEASYTKCLQCHWEFLPFVNFYHTIFLMFLSFMLHFFLVVYSRQQKA